MKTKPQKVLELLQENKNKVVEYDEIFHKIWQRKDDSFLRRTLGSQVALLRKKGHFIRTITNTGLILIVEEKNVKND